MASIATVVKYEQYNQHFKIKRTSYLADIAAICFYQKQKQRMHQFHYFSILLPSMAVSRGYFIFKPPYCSIISVMSLHS